MRKQSRAKFLLYNMQAMCRQSTGLWKVWPERKHSQSVSKFCKCLNYTLGDINF